MPEDSRATLYNKMGAVVREAKLRDGRLTIEVEDLPNGVYYLKIMENDRIMNKQVLIQH